MNIKMPINLKITLPIIAMLIGSIGYIITQSVDIQKQEKINQSYQIQLNETRLLANNFKSYVDSSLNTLRQIATLDWTNKQDAENLVQGILKNQKEVERIYLIEVPVEESDMTLLYKSSNVYGDSEEQLVKDWIVRRFEKMVKNEFVLFNLAEDRGIPQVGVAIGDFKYDEKSNKILILTAVLNTTSLFNNLSYLAEVVDYRGELIYTSDYKNLLTKEYNQKLFKKAQENKLNSATVEVEYNDQKQLGSFSKLPNNTVFLTSQPLIKVISSIYITTQKLILIGLIALSLTVYFTIRLSRSISSPISELTDATKKIAKGDFNIKVKNKKNDEIGTLATNFETMSGKIQKLLKEQVEKIRLENEMNITATIQKTLFPENTIKTEYIDIFSHASPASECGGDIWGYFTHGSKMYFIIADATGHGLPSAFITVSAKSTLSLVKRMLEQNHKLSPSQILSYANRTIFETSQGKIMMTCFVGVIDFETGVLTYSNAGHNSPWVFSGKKIHSLALPGIRLGEKSEETEFKEKTLTLQPGDKIFLYTDGITENTNTKGEMFDKKRVRKIIQDSLVNGASFSLKTLVSEFNKFLENKTEVDDDTTIVMMDIKKIQDQLKDVA